MLIDVSEQAATRVERKERTRAALLEGTLALAADRGFAALSLREIARSAGIVPTAFYRHFTSLDELGATLVDQGVRELRLALRELRRTPDARLAETVRFVFEQVDGKEDLYGFLLRERHGGSAALRGAISVELQLIVRELVVDLSRIRALDTWSHDDLELAADLIVSTVAARIADYITAAPRDRAHLIDTAVRQVRLISLGMSAWRP
ncbi:TetR family transcriptional regulator [Nocardia otitidiscaviarum]|nr:TetR family transcriptional regulator [Nocardia otitidiscaviarum]MBF6133226.1 TetR family transcriptional regulator [Nocardia otitidiscaviarum]MBF6181876.1 TetR family transcriptional regulator [Nocardia otitidiscaviarum]MBF6240951.1 TetR family transcriptional regulator [Nocardia otitidiscaviarum]MBF6486622.1 TetR family transcriptional regulator [Nocardia otitidiscaviarum]MCP9620344.1 TetR family transcriptional regulator [Nocardia otitidiscaviarum]